MKTFDRQNETRLRMTQIARRQNDIETYTSMTYFRTKTESTRPTNCTNDTNYITIIISVIRSSYHKVQCSNFKGKGVQTSNLNVQRIKIIGVISEIRSWYYFAIMIRKTAIRL